MVPPGDPPLSGVYSGVMLFSHDVVEYEYEYAWVQYTRTLAETSFEDRVYLWLCDCECAQFVAGEEPS